ncbi:MAG: GxxExxY protein [Chloroflexi bacterium]|nr:GxxExxY protein [Chloroflexota bacterium]
MLHGDITDVILGAAIAVHKALGPGLLESAYEECLCHELDLKGMSYQRQVPLPVAYKGVKLDCGYRLDVVVNAVVILELKSVEKFLPVHEAQLLTYLRLSNKKVGLLVNFNRQFSRMASSDEPYDLSPCLRASVVKVRSHCGN